MRTGTLVVVPAQCFDRFVLVSKTDMKSREGVRQHILPLRSILQPIEDLQRFVALARHSIGVADVATSGPSPISLATRL